MDTNTSNIIHVGPESLSLYFIVCNFTKSNFRNRIPKECVWHRSLGPPKYARSSCRQGPSCRQTAPRLLMEPMLLECRGVVQASEQLSRTIKCCMEQFFLVTLVVSTTRRFTTRGKRFLLFGLFLPLPKTKSRTHTPTHLIDSHKRPQTPYQSPGTHLLKCWSGSMC